MSVTGLQKYQQWILWGNATGNIYKIYIKADKVKVKVMSNLVWVIQISKI